VTVLNSDGGIIRVARGSQTDIWVLAGDDGLSSRGGVI